MTDAISAASSRPMTFGVWCPTTWMRTLRDRSVPPTPDRDGKAVLIGRDCRLSSPELAAALAEGVTSQGNDVIDLGLASTDLLYFASGSLDLPGIMLTASHNPKQYNGLKFCQPGARPVGEDRVCATSARSSKGDEIPGRGTPGRASTRSSRPMSSMCCASSDVDGCGR